MTVQLSEVMRSLAQHMHNVGVADYRPTDVYPDDLALPALSLGDFPISPIRSVAVIFYGRDPDVFTTTHSPLLRVQLAWRSDSEDPLDVMDMAEDGFRELHSLTPGLWPGGVHPLWMLRTITNKPERDQNDRWIQADSYDLQLNPGE
ncbi:phage tail terminator protein [Williamsia sp.]|uniref:phage tail terminator protein n=1 Tax=Williamsia sp. TaxID=1872085 RepID=UPI002F94806A